jgi:hypothetical protein
MLYDTFFSSLIIIFVVFLLLLLIVTIILVLTKPVKHQKQPTQETNKPRKSSKLEPDDFMLVLDWLLTHNVIDTQEYNRLVAKSLPFFG